MYTWLTACSSWPLLGPLNARGSWAPSILTHRSAKGPEGRDSWLDCLIDLLQTVGQGIPGKLWGGGPVSGWRGGGCGEGRERGGGRLGKGTAGWGGQGQHQERNPRKGRDMTAAGGEERERKTNTHKWQGKKRDTIKHHKQHHKGEEQEAEWEPPTTRL